MSWSQPPADGKTASRLQGISALRMVSDCTFMSATEDGQLTLWDVKTAAPLSTVRPTKKPVVGFFPEWR
jgi:WD40 repeat protein